MSRTTFAGVVSMARENRTLALCLLAMSAAILIGLLVAGPALAVSATFTVNRTTNEADASAADGVCDYDAATTGNQCTLRAAIQQANANTNSAETDTIKFDIPGDTRKVKTIGPTSELPAITQSVTINGYSQPGSAKNTRANGAINAVPKIQLDGSTASIDADRLIIQGASNITIRGLVINRFDRSGIFLTSTDGSDNNHIEVNFIGTNAAGTAIVANDGDGVVINGPGSTGNTIGGTTPAARNLISGNDEQGVEISASDTNKVQGNLIGTHKTGINDVGNIQDGVRMTSSSKNVVTNNVVAFNGDATHNDNGVEVLKSGAATPVGNRILSNSILQNQALGIDLSNSGTGGREQDAKDLDTGPNNLQNFPAITAATITGTLRSKPEKSFTVQLFSNPTGTDEGKTFLTQIQVKTNRRGKAIFSYFGTAVSQANAITAAATGADGTSEFSDPVAVVPAS